MLPTSLPGGSPAGMTSAAADLGARRELREPRHAPPRAAYARRARRAQRRHNRRGRTRGTSRRGSVQVRIWTRSRSAVASRDALHSCDRGRRPRRTVGACSSDPSSKTASTAPLSPVTHVDARAPSTTCPGTDYATAPQTPTAADLNALHIAFQPVVSGLDSPVDIAFRPGARYAGHDVRGRATGRLRLVRDGRFGRTRSTSATTSPTATSRASSARPSLPTARASTSTTPTPTATPTSTSTGCEATPPIRAPAGACSSSRTRIPTTTAAKSLRPRRHALHRPGRRRLGGRPPRQRPEPHDAARQDHADQPGARRRRGVLACPRTTRSSRRPGAARETWMWGLRNPWRFSFDRATGDLWIGDVGQNAYEEIDFAPHGMPGVNWGWNAREGFHAFTGARPAGARDPIVETARRRQLRDRRRLRVPGRIPCARRRISLQRQLPTEHRGPRAARRHARSHSATWACRSTSSRRSARTTPASSTPRHARHDLPDHAAT